MDSDDEVPVVDYDSSPEPSPLGSPVHIATPKPRKLKGRPRSKAQSRPVELNRTSSNASQKTAVPPIFNVMGSIVGTARNILAPTPSNQGSTQSAPVSSSTMRPHHPHSMSMSAIHPLSRPVSSIRSPGPQIQSAPASRKHSIAAEVPRTSPSPPPKSVWTTIKDGSSISVWLVFILGGILIAQYREMIEIMLHGGIDYMFVAITFLSSIGGVGVAGFAVYKYYMSWQSKRAVANATANASAIGANSGAVAETPAPLQTPTEPTFTDPFNHGLSEQPSFSYMTSFHEPVPSVPRASMQDMRSYSQPSMTQLVRPTPVYGVPNYVPGPASRTSTFPTSSHVSNPPTLHNPLPTAPIQERPLSSYFPPQPQPQPRPADIKVPFTRMSPVPSEGEGDDEPLRMPHLSFGASAPISPISPTESNSRPTMPKIKRGTFNRAKPAVFVREEQDMSNIGAEPRSMKDNYYVDSDACKPYGPPPRRYRGVNV